MFENLTKEQEAMMIPFREKWKARILRTEKTDEEIKQGIKNLYKTCGMDEPVVFIMDSPLRCQVMAKILKGIVEDNSPKNIGNNIWEIIWENIRDNVWENIKENIGENIRDNVWENIGENMEYHAWNEAASTHWYVHLLFFYEANLLPENRYARTLREYIDNVIDAWACIYFERVAIVSRKPTVYMNDAGRLHHDKLPAVEFPDGYAQHYLNGVYFPRELWERVTSGSMPFDEILAIEDTDQRTQAMLYADVDKFIAHAKGELLDEYEKIAVDGSVVNYKLYRFPRGDIFTEDAYYCLFTCPSTGKKHMEGVEVSKTVPEAMAWAEDITEEEWKARVPLVHEV